MEKNEDITSANEKDIIIDEVDYNELLELEKANKDAATQLNVLSGAIFRMSKDQEICLNNEKNILIQIEAKRKELIKRYKIDDQKKWQIDMKSRMIIYSK